MYYYRLTKYNPQFRDENGRYLKDEWTEFGEVGILYKGKILSLEEYESIEKKYIESIKLLLGCVGSFKLKCDQVEKHNSLDDIPENFRELYNQTKEGFVIDEETLSEMLKIIMRNYIWCRLVSEDILLHFDYNLYVFIRIEKPCMEAVHKINDLGLFIEDYKNPWIEY